MVGLCVASLAVRRANAPPARARSVPQTTRRCTGGSSARSAAAACSRWPAIPGDDRHFYFGAVDGGVWATQDAGRTWQPIFDGEPVGSIGAIAIAPSRPATLYVGTGEADMRSDIAQGDGMYKSTDGGAHWTHIGLTTRGRSRASWSIRTTPTSSMSPRWAIRMVPNAQRGVFRSRDGGRHWTKVLYENANTGAIDLAFKPGDPRTLYAALWQTRRPPWSVYPPSNGPGSGLYVSHDGGDHWSRVAGHGFPAHPGRIGLAVSPRESATASTRWPMARGAREASTAPTTAACSGGMSRPTRASGAAAGTSARSRPIRTNADRV